MCVVWGMEKSSMKKSKLKARRMWANCYSSDNALYAHPTKQAAIRRSFGHASLNAIPVAVIPLDDTEAIVVAAAAAHYKAWSGVGKPTNGDCMRAALTAIGVLPKARKKGGRK